VEQLQQNRKHFVSTPLDVHKLALELASHPDHSFVNNLVNALQYSTRIGYLGPQRNWVSRNLISASQHPEVITGVPFTTSPTPRVTVLTIISLRTPIPSSMFV